MEPYSILMFLFSGALLLYAGLMALTRDYQMLPYRPRQSVKPKDPKAYTLQLAKVIALVAIATALSGLVGLWRPIPAVIVLIVGAALCIWLGTRLMRKVS